MSNDRIRAIKVRWRNDGRISTVDVEWLISEAEKAETMRAADRLRGGSHGTVSDLLDGLFRR